MFTLRHICRWLAGSLTAAALVTPTASAEFPALSPARAVFAESLRADGAESSVGTVLPSSTEQRASQVVRLPREWVAGEHLQVEVKEETEQYRGAERVSGGGTLSTVDVTLLERLPEAFRLRWVWSPAELLEGSSADQQLTAALSSLTGPIAVDMRTDQYGVPLSVENEAELLATNRLAVAFLLQTLKERGTPDEHVERINQLFSSVLDEAAVQATALKDPKIFHFLAGGTFPLGTTLTYEDSLPNAFGGEPYPSRAWFEVTEVDTAHGTATIEWRQVIDRERASAIMEATLRALATHMGASDADAAQIPALELMIDDAATFVIDLHTGWPQSVQYERITSMGDQRRVQRSTFQTVEHVRPTTGA